MSQILINYLHGLNYLRTFFGESDVLCLLQKGSEFEGWWIEFVRKDMRKTFPHHAREIWQFDFPNAPPSFLFICLKNKHKTQKRKIDWGSSQYVPHVLLNKLFRLVICGFSVFIFIHFIGNPMRRSLRKELKTLPEMYYSLKWILTGLTCIDQCRFTGNPYFRSPFIRLIIAMIGKSGSPWKYFSSLHT